MFSYYAAARLGGIISTIAPVAASPLLGFGDPPDTPLSLIDFHASDDGTIPYDRTSNDSYGSGPHGSVISWDGYYYEEKPATVRAWVAKMGCGPEPVQYPTDMDGVAGWGCRKWTGCKNQVEVVHCVGQFGHDYPFKNEAGGYSIEGNRILWDFMKRHKRR